LLRNLGPVPPRAPAARPRASRGAVLGSCLALATLHLPGAARADAPYPPSAALPDLALDWSTYRRLAPGSDQWPMTRAADGALYASFQDGGGLGPDRLVLRSPVSIGIARLTGTTAASITGRNLIGGYAPAVAPCFPAFPGDAVDNRRNSPCRGVGRAGKSVGLLALGPYLHAWVSPGSGARAYREARLYRAPLGTDTWARAGWAFAAGEPRPITYPAFVQAGSGYADGGDWVYLYAAGLAPLDPDALTIQLGPGGGEVYLLRVARAADPMLRQNYQFFAGLDGAGAPLWTADPAGKRPAFVDPAGVGPKTSAAYLAPLGRYLLLTEHGRTAAGLLGVFEAPAPWGPWSTVFYGDLGAGSPLPEDTAFLAGLVPGSLDGAGGFTLAFSGTGALDALNLVDGRFAPASAR
jgi:hypothetical protein